MRKGVAHLPLHGGKAPRWLFGRMKLLAGAIVEAVSGEFGQKTFLERVSDPMWFQSLGCILGFDWHSSGLTTTTTGAIKEGIKGREEEIGLFVAGGKGRASRKTPDEITEVAERIGLAPAPLVYASRMSAKVDSAGLQDGYDIYHHVFFLTKKGDWAVVQQGMNERTRFARRYHWLSESLEDFVVEPHQGIISEKRGTALNLVDREIDGARSLIAELSTEPPDWTVRELERLKTLRLPRRHDLLLSDLSPKHVGKVLLSTYEKPPEGFADLLGRRGVGAKTLRALALLSDLLYGEKPSYRDPFVFSFAHGGKDGTPFPVEREVYDRTIEVLERAVESAKIGRKERLDALRRLSRAFG
jgi:hypothetical protein